MSDATFEERDEREADRRAAVEAADDTGLVRQAEINVRTDLDGEPDELDDRE